MSSSRPQGIVHQNCVLPSIKPAFLIAGKASSKHWAIVAAAASMAVGETIFETAMRQPDNIEKGSDLAGGAVLDLGLL